MLNFSDTPCISGHAFWSDHTYFHYTFRYDFHIESWRYAANSDYFFLHFKKYSNIFVVYIHV